MASHKKVALITHTGSDMPLDEAAGLGISIIPDKVLFGDEEYRNMTEISSEMFYEKLAAAEKLPTSSQPSLGDFVKAYRKAAEEADEVLCLMITSKMSGCYAAALDPLHVHLPADQPDDRNRYPARDSVGGRAGTQHQ